MNSEASTTALNIAHADLELFHRSLTRATADAAFFDLFYDRFIGGSPEIAEIFRHSDMAHIKKKLRTTLEIMTDSADGAPGLGMYLELLARIHARFKISHAMFAQWRGALVDTAAECDPRFDVASRGAWERIVDAVIARMLEGR